MSRSGDFKVKNIALIGFMGTGKTVVAKELAKRLKLRYVSTDALIEEHEGLPITDIFSKKGEPYFRDVESGVARDVANESGVVVDAGGGIILRDENVSALKRNCVLICLTATPDKIMERTKGHRHRPLLNVADPKARVEELLKLRAPFYAKADHQIDTSNIPISAVVDKILKVIKNDSV